MKIAEVAQVDLESCIRIQTDGIVFNKDVKLNFHLLGRDSKTTGLIRWDNVNKYPDLL